MLNMILELGTPEGSLESATIELLRQAGFNMTTGCRSYFPVIDAPESECLLVRTQGSVEYPLNKIVM